MLRRVFVKNGSDWYNRASRALRRVDIRYRGEARCYRPLPSLHLDISYLASRVDPEMHGKLNVEFYALRFVFQDITLQTTRSVKRTFVSEIVDSRKRLG